MVVECIQREEEIMYQRLLNLEKYFFQTSMWVGEHQLKMRFYQAAKLNCSVELVRC